LSRVTYASLSLTRLELSVEGKSVVVTGVVLVLKLKQLAPLLKQVPLIFHISVADYNRY
jgi:hypothetical protein